MDRGGTGRFHWAQDYLPRRTVEGRRWARGCSSAFIRAGVKPEKLLPGDAASFHTAALLAGFLVVSMLFQLAQNTALLKLLVEALQRRIDGLI